jgi:hypothetical protein
MKTVCTSASDTFFGTIAQWSGQSSDGGETLGFAAPNNSLSISISPPSCSYLSGNVLTYMSDTNMNWPNYMRQYVAYIPDTDHYGNDLHGVPATGPGPTVSNGKVTRDGWLYQVNNQCEPGNQSSCKNLGDLWSKYPGTGSGSNFFPGGSAYPGKFRPDQPNSLVAAGMNGTMSEAYRIRSDTTYHPVIHTIYLTGNSTDSVDREFLPIVANAGLITALPYDPLNFVPYVNPAYQASQETGRYLVTSDKNSLVSLFGQLASEVLRLSK